MSDPRTLSADEFEYLALMGRTQAGDLIVGEGGAERVLRRAKQLALAPDDVLDVYVPGRLRCPQCKFQVSNATLSVSTGDVGASKAEVYQETEPCPNDGTLMDRVTWRQEADANREYATKLIEDILQASGANSLPAAMEQLSASRHPETDEAVEPGTTLERSWEGFAEERSGMLAAAPLAFARQAFYAGAQSFCAAMAGALDDKIDDEESTKLVDAVYAELAAALTELKL